jgi:SAM-dependent methyltransferase
LSIVGVGDFSAGADAAGTPHEPADARLYSPAAARNRDPILGVLRRALPESGCVLEVASGTGEHVAHFAAALPRLVWQPSDPSPSCRASIDAWADGAPNIRPAVALDAACRVWPVVRADAVICINMIHISPWAACEGLMAGAARLLGQGGVLALYGPYRRAGLAMAPGNAAFDADLRARDPDWGLRILEDVAGLAASCGFGAPAIEAMPADNLMLLFRQG